MLQVAKGATWGYLQHFLYLQCNIWYCKHKKKLQCNMARNNAEEISIVKSDAALCSIWQKNVLCAKSIVILRHFWVKLHKNCPFFEGRCSEILNYILQKDFSYFHHKKMLLQYCSKIRLFWFCCDQQIQNLI